MVAWNVAHKMSYTYVRSHMNEMQFRDTIVISAEAVKGNAELIWIEHNEIRYRGRMYDIKKQIPLPGGRVMLAGHYDHWDNGLFKTLEQLLEPEPGRHPQKEEQTFFWLADAVIPNNQSYLVYYPDSALRRFTEANYFFHFRFCPDIPVPPPDRCSV